MSLLHRYIYVGGAGVGVFFLGIVFGNILLTYGPRVVRASSPSGVITVAGKITGFLEGTANNDLVSRQYSRNTVGSASSNWRYLCITGTGPNPVTLTCPSGMTAKAYKARPGIACGGAGGLKLGMMSNTSDPYFNDWSPNPNSPSITYTVGAGQTVAVAAICAR